MHLRKQEISSSAVDLSTGESGRSHQNSDPFKRLSLPSIHQIFQNANVIPGSPTSTTSAAVSHSRQQPPASFPTSGLLRSEPVSNARLATAADDRLFRYALARSEPTQDPSSPVFSYSEQSEMTKPLGTRQCNWCYYNPPPHFSFSRSGRLPLDQFPLSQEPKSPHFMRLPSALYDRQRPPHSDEEFGTRCRHDTSMLNQQLNEWGYQQSLQIVSITG